MDKKQNNKETEFTEETQIVEAEILEGEVVEVQKPQNIFVRFVKGFGTGSLYAGGGVLFILFQIIQFAVPAIVGLSMILWAIFEFTEGSIIVGLLVLLIGTPIAIGIAHWAATFIFFLAILALIIWGISNLFGANLSFDSAWDIAWLIIKILVVGGIGYFLIMGFVDAIRTKTIKSFLSGNWFYIIGFCFLFWLFFL